MKHAMLIILAALIAAGLLFWFYSQRTVAGTVRVGDHAYRVERAETIVAQAKGLSGRASLGEDEAMLFVFSGSAIRYFWMKDMNFPLDVLWIREGKVVGLQENIPHPAANNGETFRFQSPEPADAVLEINAGQIAKHDLHIGDNVLF